MGPRTRLLFLESPSNPLLQVATSRRWPSSRTAAARCSPSTTALHAGPAAPHRARRGPGDPLRDQVPGRPGALPRRAWFGDRKRVGEEVFGVIRTAGPSMSPFNAWCSRAARGRSTSACASTRATPQILAEWLEEQPGVASSTFPARGAPAEGPGRAPAVGPRRHRRVRGPRPARGGLARDRSHPHALDHRQSRRRAQHDHASGDDDARPAHRGGAGAGRHRRRAHPRSRSVSRPWTTVIADLARGFPAAMTEETGEQRVRWDQRHAAAADMARRRGAVAQRAPAAGAGEALDLACGRGANALWLAGRTALHVHAWDFSPVAVATLEAAADARGLRIATEVRDRGGASPPPPGLRRRLSSLIISSGGSSRAGSAACVREGSCSSRPSARGSVGTRSLDARVAPRAQRAPGVVRLASSCGGPREGRLGDPAAGCATSPTSVRAAQ